MVARRRLVATAPRLRSFLVRRIVAEDVNNEIQRQRSRLWSSVLNYQYQEKE